METTTPLDAENGDSALDDLPVLTMAILMIIAVATAFLLTALDPKIGGVLVVVFAVAYTTVRILLRTQADGSAPRCGMAKER